MSHLRNVSLFKGVCKQVANHAQSKLIPLPIWLYLLPTKKRNHTNRMQLDSSYQIIRQLGTNLFMIHS